MKKLTFYDKYFYLIKNPKDLPSCFKNFIIQVTKTKYDEKN